MNKIIVSLITILSLTFIKMERKLQTQSLWNTTQLPYRYQGYRYNMPYYNLVRNNSNTTIVIEDKPYYTNNQNNGFQIYINSTSYKNGAVTASVNNINGVYQKTKNDNTSYKVVYNTASTTENYNKVNLNKTPPGNQSFKNNNQIVIRVLDTKNVSSNKTSNRLNQLCKNGCDSDWTPIPGNPYQKNMDHTKQYDVTTDNSVLVRLKSYMKYHNQTKNSWINTNQKISSIDTINNNRTTILNKIEKYNITQPIKIVNNIYDNIQNMYPPYQTINYDDETVSNVNLSKNHTSLISYKHSDSLTSGSDYKKNILDQGRRLYPDRSYYYSDYDYHKWYYNDQFSEKHSDPHSWKWLKEHYYCKKYCHCCKEHEHYHVKQGIVDNVIHFLKNFGFNSGYDFFYGRSIIDDYNPLMYVTNLYRRYSDDYDLHDDQDLDETFVYFDHDHGEPDHVADCKDLCSCCHTEVVVKLKKKLHALKWKRINTKRLQGLIGALKHMLISDDDDCGDDCGHDYDDYETDRSFDDPGGYDHFEEIYEPDHIYEHPEESHGHDVYAPSYSYPHHHYSHDVDHHHYFDCSKCCRFCKKTTIKVVKEHGKKKHRKWHRKRLHKKGLWKSIKHLLRHKIPGISFEEEDDEDDHDKHGHWSHSTNQCCNDMSGVKVLVVVVIVAVIIIQSFSSVNIIIVVIIPIIFFGVIIILIFLLLQAIIPIYLIPIIMIILMLIAAPILMLIALLLLILPIILMPIFFPFMLRLNGTTPYSLPNITCTKPFNLPVNCVIGSTPVYQTDTTEDYESSTVIIENADLTTVENDIEPTELAITSKGQLEVPETLYSKINSALSSNFCLERIGCHMAIFTRSFGFYNAFILRILENLSVPINESKFVSYKDAYQIGSLNNTDHEKCVTLYYCKKLDSLIIKN